MTVTSKKGNDDKIHIYIDGDYCCTVYDTYWYTSGIVDGDTINEEELASLKSEAGFRSAFESGVRYLSNRAHSQKELFLKLSRKYDKISSQKAIDKLMQMGYLDDEAYARMLTEHLYNRKCWDARRIRLELRSKGVSSEIAEAIIVETIDNDPTSRIIMLLNTKFSGALCDEKKQKRVFSSLLRMGYAPADVHRAFSLVGEELTEMDSEDI